VRFTWDPRKAKSNEAKHGVSFVEAVTVFADELALVAEDELHPGRELITGLSAGGRILVTVFAEVHDDEIRIISARRATRHERRHYEEGKVR
jgi:uncharacterized DUF497 family protein